MADERFIVPAGTQVVARVATGTAGERRPRGAVGVIESSPVDRTHGYAIRFADGGLSTLNRTAFAIRKQHQTDGLGATTSDQFDELESSVILRVVVGSRAFGLSDEGSDTDRRGIFLPSAARQWSIAGVPEQIERESTQEAYWELGKALVLALKANPNVLETLWSPLVETVCPPADELLAERRRFLSRLVYQTYNGYVLSQFKKLQADLRITGSVRWKHVMHLLRLLGAGVAVLTDGEVRVDAGPIRERLLAVRRGEVAWEDVEAWRRELHRDFDRAYASTSLPERPDYAWADDFLIRARRGMVDA